MIDLYALYQRMHDNNIMLTFKGEVTFDLIDSILKIMEGGLEQLEDSRKTKKKVYNVLVECLQNLCHHIDFSDSQPPQVISGDEHDYLRKSAILIIFSDDDAYHVATGNYITGENVAGLQKWLDEINSTTKDELRSLYKKILDNEKFSEKGGGGLGFIDIARKSGQKLNYKFKEINDTYSFFSFQINIPKA